jgi:hypothetical protein
MIFKIESTKDVFESNPSLKAFEKMSVCSSRELKWIFLTYDYETPLRNIPIYNRKETAARMAGFLNEPNTNKLDKNARNTIFGKIEKVNQAIEEFMSIQYDEEQDLLSAYREQREQAIAVMKKKDKDVKDWDLALKLTKILPDLLSAKKELEKKLGMREETSSSVEEESLSTLDMWHEEE